MAHAADWLWRAKWGVFCHYLAPQAKENGGKEMTAAQWNARVDGFDVGRLVRTIRGVGAGYFVLTLGQNSGHFCSPNKTYDRLVGIRPSKCSRRDLIMEVAEGMAKEGIGFMAYLPSGAPAADVVAKKKLGWEWGFKGEWPTAWETGRTGKRLVSFQKKWEAVIRTWSKRYGKKVAGWWIDGCYFADEMYRGKRPPNFASLAGALRAGNRKAVVAFNPGVMTPVISMTQHEDFTAGELSEAFAAVPGRFVRPKDNWRKEVQYHVLSYLGATWGGGEPRFTNGFVTGYTGYVNAKGGAVTWDVPIGAGGEIPQSFVRQLKVLGKAAGR